MSLKESIWVGKKGRVRIMVVRRQKARLQDQMKKGLRLVGALTMEPPELGAPYVSDKRDVEMK